MIDKKRAYRFRGDSERWVWARSNRRLRDEKCTCTLDCRTVDHLLAKNILLEYPELPGEDWEFCESVVGAEKRYCEAAGWNPVSDTPCKTCEPIYCRKKKPVITEVEGKVIPNASDHYVYILCDSERDFLKDGDRVKVTKL